MHFLLDQPPTRKRAVRFAGNAGEGGSGRTRDIYEGALARCVIDTNGNMISTTEEKLDRATTFSIGKGGQLVCDFNEVSSDGLNFERDFAFALLTRSLEDQFKMPRSPLPQSKPHDLRLAKSTKLTDFRGKVIDLGGRPIGGARIAERFVFSEMTAVTTERNGEFVLRMPVPTNLVSVTVEAAGFAVGTFQLSVDDDNQVAGQPRGFMFGRCNGQNHRTDEYSAQESRWWGALSGMASQLLDS